MPWKFTSPKTHRKPRVRAKAAYRGMKQRCKNVNGKNKSYLNVELKMTEGEWLEWAVPLYETFLEAMPDESPCASRKNDTGHYGIGNIEIISVKENRKRQKADRPAALTHGSLSSYRYCKCELCKKANRDHRREYRARKKKFRIRGVNSNMADS